MFVRGNCVMLKLFPQVTHPRLIFILKLPVRAIIPDCYDMRKPWQYKTHTFNEWKMELKKTYNEVIIYLIINKILQYLWNQAQTPVYWK